MLILPAIFHLIAVVFGKKGKLAIIALILCCRLTAQETSFVPITGLSVANGLSSSNIRKIVQDKYGFLWIATQDGLNRFDGRQVEVLNAGNKTSSRNLPGQDIFDIIPDSTGNYLYALFSYAGLSKIDIRTVSVVKSYLYSNSKGQPDNWNKCLARKGNMLYIGTNEGTVIGFDTKQEKQVLLLHTSELLDRVYPVDKIQVTPEGLLYLFLSGKGIMLYDPVQQKMIRFISAEELYLRESGFQFTDVAEHAGIFWITTSMGLRCLALRNNQVQYPRQLQTTPSLWFLNTYLSSVSVYNGKVMYSGKEGLFQTDTTLYNPIQIRPTRSHENQDFFQLANCIYQQGAVIWVGSQYGLAWVKNRFSPFMGLSNSLNGNGNRIKHSMGMLPLSDSVLAVCSDDALFFANLRNGSLEQFAVPDFYMSVFKVPDNLFIASGDQGFQLFDAAGKSQKLEQHFPELSSIKNDLLIGATSFADSMIFMASQNQKGLHCWNTLRGTVTNINTQSEGLRLQSNVINRLFVDSRKRLWILCDNVISLYDVRLNSIQHFTLKDPVHQKPLSVIMDICEMANSIWLAVYGTGIVSLKEDLSIKAIYSQQHGINNVGLYKLMKLSDSTLMASSNNGLSVLNIRTGKAMNYFEEDGLHSSSFEETSGAMSGNYLFFGGFNGFTRIDPKKLNSNPPSPVLYFSSASVRTETSSSDTLDIFMKQLIIPEDASQVTVHFSAVNFTSPEKVRYQYMLMPISKQWEDGGHEPFLNLVGIGPGTYTLQVRASNEAGVWSEPVQLILQFKPKWFQTWWFTALLILMGVLIAFVLYRIRMHQLAREEGIRKKLSNDLHDDLGSTLNSVKVHANLAILDPDNRLHLQRIKESVQQAIVSTRDLIWVLDDKKDTVDHLISRLMQFAEPLCDAQGVALKKDISSDAWNVKLGKEERRNLYMIMKESINNSIKYAACSSIILQISYSNKRLFISVSDNGKGFNPATVTPGNGTINIRSRAEAAGYAVNIYSAPDRGTSVQLMQQ